MHRCFPALLLVPMLADYAECAVHNMRLSLRAFLLTLLVVGCGAQSPSRSPEPTREVPFAVSGPVSGPGTTALEAGTDITLDGWDGKRLELAQPVQCDEAPIGLTPAVGRESWEITIRGGWAPSLWVLDVDGLRFVVMASYEPGTPAEVRQDLTLMVNSIDIEPEQP
jgi:hypothetical protein